MLDKPTSDFKCPDCGADFTLDRNPELEGSFSRFLDNIQILCDECAQKREDEENSAKAREGAEKCLRAAYGLEYLPIDARECFFEKSTPEAEALNQEHWDYARTVKEGNLWICGPPGVGKSWLCYCLLNETLVKGNMVYSVAGPTLNACAHAYFSERTKVLNRTKQAKVLLIDDIDKATWSPQGISLLWEVLDARQRARLRVLITSNQSPEDFVQALKRAENATHVTAIMDRLHPCHRMVMQGVSLRRV